MAKIIKSLIKESKTKWFRWTIALFIPRASGFLFHSMVVFEGKSWNNAMIVNGSPNLSPKLHPRYGNHSWLEREKLSIGRHKGGEEWKWNVCFFSKIMEWNEWHGKWIKTSASSYWAVDEHYITLLLHMHFLRNQMFV